MGVASPGGAVFLHSDAKVPGGHVQGVPVSQSGGQGGAVLLGDGGPGCTVQAGLYRVMVVAGADDAVVVLDQDTVQPVGGQQVDCQALGSSAAVRSRRSFRPSSRSRCRRGDRRFSRCCPGPPGQPAGWDRRRIRPRGLPCRIRSWSQRPGSAGLGRRSGGPGTSGCKYRAAGSTAVPGRP